MTTSRSVRLPRHKAYCVAALCGLLLCGARAVAQDAACPTGVRDVATDDGGGHRIPVETIVPAKAPSLIAGLAFDTVGAALTRQTLTADVSVDVILDMKSCPAFRLPLGLGAVENQRELMIAAPRWIML